MSYPKGCVKCPTCEGEGKILISYNDPGPNTYWDCILCYGLGYVEEDYLKHFEELKTQSEFALKEDKI
jgi:RecJ-like exonuclease